MFIDLQTVKAAHERIAPYIHRTPVLTCAALDGIAGRRLFFKCENLQKIGAFKVRGACNMIMQLPDEAAARGIVTHSSGNHAQAVAYAARLRGVPAHIVMPEGSSKVKAAAVAGYGGRIVSCGADLASRETVADGVLQETGGVLVPPFDHPHIIAGQGTVALEMLEDAPDLDAIVAPVGGGGLLSGTIVAATALKPGIQVFGAEPAGADDAARSLAAGAFVPQTAPDTICDGLRTSLGEHTWPVIRDGVRTIITVDDAAIVEAMRLIWSRMKMIVEPNSAITLAVVMSERFCEMPGLDRVGLVVSGGNVDLDALPW